MSCPRLTYVWACLQVAFAGHLKPECKWCFDGTTFEINDDGANGMVVIQYDADDKSPIRSTENQQSLSVYIKWMYLGSALGASAPIFLVFAINGMDPDTHYIHDVTGLSASSDYSVTGYVAFADSRAGNAALWKDYFIRFVIPQLSKSQNTFQTKVYSGYILFIN